MVQTRPSSTRNELATSYSAPSRSPRTTYGSRGEGVNSRDDLLMMLLSSQAVLDSRDFEVLSAEEVEELKTVRVAPLLTLSVNNLNPRIHRRKHS